MPLFPDQGTAPWIDFTPTLVQSGAVTKTVTYARYYKVGRLVVCNISLACTGAGTASNAIVVGLPVAAVIGPGPAVIGSGYVYDATADAPYRSTVELSTSTTVVFRGASVTTNTFLGSGSPMTAALASGDLVVYSVSYESAA